jgi:hypothetical protein
VPRHAVDIFDPSVLADFKAIYQNCLSYSVLHELGHAAGLAHEPYCPDDAAKRAACYAYEQSIGIDDVQPGDVSPRYRGTRTLGATLSPEDVQMMPVLYGLAPDPYDTGGCSVSGAGQPTRLGGLAVALLLVGVRLRRRGRGGFRSFARAPRRRSCSPRSRCRSSCA